MDREYIRYIFIFLYLSLIKVLEVISFISNFYIIINKNIKQIKFLANKYIQKKFPSFSSQTNFKLWDGISFFIRILILYKNYYLNIKKTILISSNLIDLKINQSLLIIKNKLSGLDLILIDEILKWYIYYLVNKKKICYTFCKKSMILNFTWKLIGKITIPGDLFYFEAKIYEIFRFNKILAGLLVECYKCNSLFIYNFNSTILETPFVCIKNNCSSRKFFFKKKKIILMTFTKIKFIKEDLKKNKFLFFDKALIPNFKNSLKIGDKIIIFGMFNVISISNNLNMIENKKNIYSFYFISKKLVLKNKYNTSLGYFKYKEMYFLLRIVRYNDFFFFLMKRSRFNSFLNKILFLYVFFFSLANKSFFKGIIFPKNFFFKFSSSIRNILSYFDSFFFLNFEEKKMRKNKPFLNYHKKKHVIVLQNFSLQNICEPLLSYDNLKSSNQNNCILIFKSKSEKLRSLIQLFPLNFINLKDYFIKNIYSTKKKISNILLSAFKIKNSHFEIKKKKHINFTKLALSKYFFKKCLPIFQMQKKPYLTKIAHEFLVHLYSNNIKDTCNGFRHNVVSFVIKLAEIRIKFLFKIFVSLEDILEIIDILSLNNELILKNPIIKLKNFLTL